MKPDIDPEPANPRPLESRTREFAAADGRYWTVRELPPSQYDRRGPSLVFVNEEIMRRVRRYPARWFDLSDEELFALSMGY